MQPERTALAWSRVALLLTVNALIAARTGLESGRLLYTVVAVVLFIIAAAAFAYGAIRRQQLLGPDQPAAPAAVAMATLAIVTTLACIAGVLSALLA